MQDLAVLFEKYAGNILTPIISEKIVDEFGVSVSALKQLGIGYNPVNAAFIFPERDSYGKIIGLTQRHGTGRKTMIEGSNRGLYYPVDMEIMKENKYVPGAHNWTRIQEADISCPICGKPDWCLVSANNPTDPDAVLCGRISEGCTTKLDGSGFLHILKAGGARSHSASRIIPTFEGPILITEGYSDTASAIDMGFMAIGKPSAEFNAKILVPLVKDQDVVIVGDNDEGAGKRGMEATFQVLKGQCKSLRKVFPPEKYKDLRRWKTQVMLDKDTFLKWVDEHGESAGDPNVLDDGAAVTVAKAWLDSKRIDGVPITRSYLGQWTQFDGSYYKDLDVRVLRGDIYTFLKDKSFPKMRANGKPTLASFRPTRSQISDILDALNQWCPIDDNPPCWLRKTDKPDPKDLIVFQNGMLDVNR
ncbi:hypothetical protein LCGC14_2686340, partial [marine sediment metagenome]